MYKKIIMSVLFFLCIVGCQPIDSSTNTEKEETSTTEQKEGISDNKEQEDVNEQKMGDEDTANVNMNQTDGELSIHYIDVGQADATLFHYEGEEDQYSILYDTGDWLGSEVVPYLQNEGIKKLDLVIISHPHADHIGQLKPVMLHFPVDEVWMTGNTSNSNAFTEALETVLESEANYVEPRAGDEFNMGPLKLTVLHPAKLTGELNEDSLSIHVQFLEHRFLFTGDASKHEEQLMIDREESLEADVLQLGHHGSDTSSAEAFIHEVDPSYAIYSAGKDNSYGHPHKETVSLFDKKGIPLYGTDEFGTIIMTADEEHLTLSTEKEATSSIEKEEDKEDQQNTASEHKKEVTSSSASRIDDCIDINKDSKKVLISITHIGPSRADELIELRPFSSVDELTQIKGIGEQRLQDIKQKHTICIGGN